MKRLLWLPLLLAVLFLAMPAPVQAQTSIMDNVVKRGVLRVGFSTFMPWAMQDKQGEYIGFEIDVARQLAKDLEVELQLVPTNWDGIIPALLSGRFDVIIGGMSITPQRALSVNFTIPYDYSYIDLTLNKEKAGQIMSAEELNAPEIVITARTGTTAAQIAQRFFPLATLRLFNDEPPAVEEVLSGRAHAFVSSSPLPAMETARNPDRLVQNFEFAVFRNPIAFAVPKGDFDTLNVFESWIRLKEAEGWLQERRDYWFRSTDWESLVQ